MKPVAPSDEDFRAAISVQASEWFIDQQAGGLSEQQGRAFLSWLQTSPVHVREYLAVARIAHHLPAAVGGPDVPLATFLEQARRDFAPPSPRLNDWPLTRLRWLPWRRALALATCLLALAAGALWWARDGERLGLPKTYRTAHGQQEVVQLPDGSRLRLDSDTAATVRYSGEERLIELDRGQVLVEVARGDRRQLRLATAVAAAVAVGTRFDVYRRAGPVEITVAEGAIAVLAGHPPQEVRRINAGYQVRIDPAGQSAQPVRVNLDEVLSWVEHKIAFERRPLGEVASEFNCYATVPIEIEDAELRLLPVSGVFDAADTESFLAFLETLPGVQVERTREKIRVSRVAPAS